MSRLWSDLGPIKITVQSWGATRAHLLYVHFPHRHLSFKGCGCGGGYIENPAYGKKRKVVSLPYFSRSTVCLMVVLCKSGESLEKSWSGLGQNITLRSLASSWESLKNHFLLPWLYFTNIHSNSHCTINSLKYWNPGETYCKGNLLTPLSPANAMDHPLRTTLKIIIIR